MIHLLGRPESDTLTSPHAGRGGEPRELSFAVSGKPNDAATAEGGLAASAETENILTIHFSSHASWNLPRDTENLRARKTPHRNV